MARELEPLFSLNTSSSGSQALSHHRIHDIRISHTETHEHIYRNVVDRMYVVYRNFGDFDYQIVGYIFKATHSSAFTTQNNRNSDRETHDLFLITRGRMAHEVEAREDHGDTTEVTLGDNTITISQVQGGER